MSTLEVWRRDMHAMVQLLLRLVVNVVRQSLPLGLFVVHGVIVHRTYREVRNALGSTGD